VAIKLFPQETVVMHTAPKENVDPNVLPVDNIAKAAQATFEAKTQPAPVSSPVILNFNLEEPMLLIPCNTKEACSLSLVAAYLLVNKPNMAMTSLSEKIRRLNLFKNDVLSLRYPEYEELQNILRTDLVLNGQEEYRNFSKKIRKAEADLSRLNQANESNAMMSSVTHYTQLVPTSASAASNPDLGQLGRLIPVSKETNVNLRLARLYMDKKSSLAQKIRAIPSELEQTTSLTLNETECAELIMSIEARIKDFSSIDPSNELGETLESLKETACLIKTMSIKPLKLIAMAPKMPISLEGTCGSKAHSESLGYTPLEESLRSDYFPAVHPRLFPGSQFFVIPDSIPVGEDICMVDGGIACKKVDGGPLRFYEDRRWRVNNQSAKVEYYDVNPEVHDEEPSNQSS
jgi:hypothetical protein